MSVPGRPVLAVDPPASDGRPGLPEPAEPVRPLSGRRHAFWILQQLLPDTAVSNLVVAFRTERPLRWWPLHAALNHLVARHPALRTRFPAAAGVPLEHVSPAAAVQATVEVGAAGEAELMERLAERAWRPFDLAADLPLRAFLCQVDGGGSAVLLVVHHIVADGGSLASLVEELAAAYDAIAAGANPAELGGELQPGAAPQPRPEALAFWAEHLRGVDAAAAALPWARPAAVPPTFAGATTARPLDAEAVAAVEELRRALGSTENLVLLTAWYLTLLRHGAGSDLVVGVPVDGGGTGVGFRVSTLPLRVVLDPTASFADCHRRVRDVFLAGVAHASASVEEVLAELGHRSADWRVPLFRYMFNYRPWDEGDVTIAGERPVSLEVFRGDSRLDINLVVVAGRRPPVLLTNYSTELFDHGDVMAMLRRMEVLLRGAAADAARPVTDLPLATDDERVLLAAVNATRHDEHADRTVADRFAARARARPAATAVVDDGVTVTYAQLAAGARWFADRLRAEGIRAGDVVALALPRGAAMAAAVFGVWEAGASYLPLDPAQPVRRLAALMADAGSRVLVTGPAGPGPEDLEAEHAVDVRVVAAPGPATGGAAPPETVAGPAPEAAAYVIHTSGSTGRPRGVVITHRNLANVVADFADRLGVTADDAILWSTTTAFDISALELLLPLTTGGTVVVAGGEAQARPRELLDLVAEHDVSVVQATPTFWRLVVEQAAGEALRGRTVLCGGEPMSAALARDLLATGCRLFNVYGPTETTIWSTVAEIDEAVADPVPVGVPIANTEVFVVDEYGAELPPGLLGELCIGGAGVGVGYLGRPELTRERFVTGRRGRHYRTGDLARWRSDGVLELFGRNDRQVKVRGHRIELPEIEAVLRTHAEVVDAAVVVVGDPQSDAELRAFVRPANGAVTAGLPGRLWPHLRERLPSYALPSRVVVVDGFPVTPNGKIDHAALRRREVPDSPAASADPVEGWPDPEPELTRQLLALWRETLDRPELGERDHFFLNGGHSLLAVHLAGRTADVVGTPVDVRMIFDHPTARRLSARLVEERRP